MMCYCVFIATYPLSEPHKSTDEVEWQGDAEPEAEQRQQSGERDGRTGSRPPQEEVEHEEHPKHNPEIGGGRGKTSLHPQ